MAKEEIRESFTDYSSLVGSNMGIILLSFISIPLLVRILGVADYGRLNLFFMVSQIAIVLVARWTSSAVVRFGKEEFIKKKKISGTFWARSFMSLPAYAVVAAVLYIFRAELTGYIGLPSARHIWLVIAYIGFLWCIDCGHNISKATKRMRLYAAMELLERIILIALLGLVFFMPAFRGGLVLIIVFYLVRQALVSLYFLCRNKTNFIYPVKLDRGLISDVFKFSAPLFIVSAGTMVMGWVDVFVIKMFLNVESVGLYSLSYKLMSYLRMLSTHSATVILPILISFHVAKKDDMIKKYVRRFIPQITFFWSCFVSAVMIVMYFGFRFIFGESFAPSLNAFFILLLGLSSYILFSLHRPLIHVYKLTGKVFFITLAALAVNVLLDFILVPVFGIYGAATATAVSIFTMVVMQFRVTSAYMKIFDIKQFSPLLVACLTFVLFTFVAKTALLQVFSIGVILIFGWVIVKKGKIFRKQDIGIIEEINMPKALKRAVKNVITVLA